MVCGRHCCGRHGQFCGRHGLWPSLSNPILSMSFTCISIFENSSVTCIFYHNAHSYLILSIFCVLCAFVSACQICERQVSDMLLYVSMFGTLYNLHVYATSKCQLPSVLKQVRIYYGSGTGGCCLHMRRADASCALTRWQHFSA